MKRKRGRGIRGRGDYEEEDEGIVMIKRRWKRGL